MEKYVNFDDLVDAARGTDNYYVIRGIIGMQEVEKISVTRCSKCLYFDVDPDHPAQDWDYGWCSYWNKYTYINGYCSEGG